MNETIFQDSLEAASEILKNSTGTANQINWWMWLAIVELAVIAILILKNRFKPNDDQKRKFKKESLEQEIDFNNIINSSFNSRQLFDELKVRCHPDRFPSDKEQNRIAQNLFQEITKNKNNVKRLLELKNEAQQKLNINF